MFILVLFHNILKLRIVQRSINIKMNNQAVVCSLNGIQNSSEIFYMGIHINDFPGGSDSKVSVYNAGDPGSIPGLGRSPGEGNGNLLQDYCLENPMDKGAR